MNGDDKKYLEIENVKLKTLFDEKWRAHDKGANERANTYCKKFDEIKEYFSELFKK